VIADSRCQGAFGRKREVVAGSQMKRSLGEGQLVDDWCCPALHLIFLKHSRT
jgi:hypothetical protein